MTKFGKWLGGSLGWAFGGPIGAIVGFAIGAVIDDTRVVSDATGVKRQTQTGDFTSSLLVLCAAVIKADGKILKSELDYIKTFFVKHFGVDHTREQMLVLREILKQDIPIHEVCRQIKQYMEYPSRVQLLHFLFGIAANDGEISSQELEIITAIANQLGISLGDYNSIKNMFIRNHDSDYAILEVASSATDEEVKKAYRKMAIKFHPDKVAHLGDEYQKDAKEKFQKVQEAYENIRKQRGIS
jgi:DnaJ like chaperone protein